MRFELVSSTAPTASAHASKAACSSASVELIAPTWIRNTISGRPSSRIRRSASPPTCTPPAAATAGTGAGATLAFGAAGVKSGGVLSIFRDLASNRDRIRSRSRSDQIDLPSNRGSLAPSCARRARRQEYEEMRKIRRGGVLGQLREEVIVIEGVLEDVRFEVPSRSGSRSGTSWPSRMCLGSPFKRLDRWRRSALASQCLIHRATRATAKMPSATWQSGFVTGVVGSCQVRSGHGGRARAGACFRLVHWGAVRRGALRREGDDRLPLQGRQRRLPRPLPAAAPAPLLHPS